MYSNKTNNNSNSLISNNANIRNLIVTTSCNFPQNSINSNSIIGFSNLSNLSNDVATKASISYVDNKVSTEINKLVGSAPQTLDTIYELGQALNNDNNAFNTLNNLIATKATINNPTFTGTVVIPSSLTFNGTDLETRLTTDETNITNNTSQILLKAS
jgi:hypothetical protein